MTSPQRLRAVRRYVHEVLDGERREQWPARLITAALAILIVANVADFAIESVISPDKGYRTLFDTLFYASVGIFTIEYLLRAWSCVEHESGVFDHPLRGRLRHLLSPLMLVDLAALLPFYFGAALGVDLRFLRLLRLLWLLKITRALPALGALGRVLRRESRTLAAVFVVMLVMLFIASCLIYLLEHERQPYRFATVFDAMWWSVTTLTTVGYGDLVPLSTGGRVLGMLTMFLGIGTFALPAGVLASAFYEERKRRDFLLTWNLVAQVPLFAHLTAEEIANVANLLHPRNTLPREVLFRRGDEAESMYFIVSGAVEIELQPKPRRLGHGDFFGEISLVMPVKRTATVIALRRCQLLELDAQDMHSLFENNPALKAKIVNEAHRRAARTPGDGPGEAGQA